MQGAITSLRATVNNLLQNEIQSTCQNSLETHYNSDTRNTTAAVPNILQHRIPADDLPHIDVVLESLRKSIVSEFTKKRCNMYGKGHKDRLVKMHKGLFQLLIGGSKTKLCDHFSQVDHQSPFCPTQINVVQGSRQRPSFGQDQSNDRYG